MTIKKFGFKKKGIAKGKANRTKKKRATSPLL